MDVVTRYWWPLVLPAFLIFWVGSIRRVPHMQWEWLVSILGVVMPSAGVTWLITGDIENSWVTLTFSGVGSALGCIAVGVVALAAGWYFSVSERTLP